MLCVTFVFAVCFRAIDNVVEQFLGCRRETINVLSQIYVELQSFGKGVNKANRVTKTVSLVAGVTSGVLFLIAPATGGTSAAGGMALLGFSGAAAATSLGTRVYQHIKEKGLIKRAKRALDAERQISERLHEMAVAARELAFIATDSANFVQNAARLGVMAMKEAQEVLQLSKTAVAAKITQVLAVTNRVTEILRIASSSLIIVSISFDVLSLLADIKNNKTGNYSEAANKIWEMAEELTKEYFNIHTALEVLSALQGDEAYLV